MTSENLSKGIIFALLAGLSNATIGLFTNISFTQHMPPEAIAFYRCIIALGITSLCLIIGRSFSFSWRELLKTGTCALFGVFVLYFFETLAYRYTSITNVTFLLMGTSAILTFTAGNFFLKEKITLFRFIGLLLVLFGVFSMIYQADLVLGSLKGNIFAILAGCGYAIFLLLTRKLKIKGSLQILWYFFLAGSVYLAIPCFVQQNFHLTTQAIPSLLILSIIPTLGGFYFTTKALTYMEASRTQLFELSEPVFASLFGLFILGQELTGTQIIGGMLILLGLFTAELKVKMKLRTAKILTVD